MEREIKKIADFCLRRKKVISFQSDGSIWLGCSKHTANELVAEMNDDNQRLCHEKLVAGVRRLGAIESGSLLRELLKASEECLAR